MSIDLYDPTTNISFFFRTYSLSDLNPTNALMACLGPVLNLKLNCFAVASINSTFSLNHFLTVLREFFINSSVSLQGLLGNASFVALFLAMVFYWIDTSFHSFLPNKKSKPSNSFAVAGFTKGGIVCMTIANGLLVSLLLLRWQVSGHFPLSNLYESLMFLCWSCTSIHFLILNTLPSTDFLIAKLIGCITSPCALMMNAYASFSLPKDMQNAAPLVPALQSNWLMMHVTVMILSYAALIVGSLLAIAFLIVSAWTYREPSRVIGSEQHVTNGPKAFMELNSKNFFGLLPFGKKPLLNLSLFTWPNRSQSLMSIKSPPFFTTGAYPLIPPYTGGTEVKGEQKTVESSKGGAISMFDNVAPRPHPPVPPYLCSLKPFPEGITSYPPLLLFSLFKGESGGPKVRLSSEARKALDNGGGTMVGGSKERGVHNNTRLELNTELKHPELTHNLDNFNNLFPLKEGEQSCRVYKENTKFTDTYRQKLMKNLDNLSYRLLGVGFPFLTIGILSGAVWANEAWGSYWSWDPKETWALLTWLVFAIYLHTRLTKGWEGQKPAIIASFGFIVVWVCFLGVNLIGEGLHSYGWLS